MGRPQKISFQCQYCNKILKRKNYYEIHLLSHSNISGEKRKARARSNWCHVCRRRFTSADFKIHIMNEHQFDSHLRLIDSVSESKSDEDSDTEIFKEEGNLSPKKKIKQELDRISKAKSPRKTALKLSKNLRTEAACSSIKIKSERDNETLVIPRKRGRKPKMRSPPICDICGLECKNERGIKIHKSTIHKRNSPSKKPKTTPEDKKIESDELKEVLPEPTSQHMNSGMPSTNSQQLYFQVPLSGLGQNAQSRLIYNPFPNQTTQKINSLHNKNETSHTDVKVQCYQPKPQQTNQYINYVTPLTNNQQLYVQGPLLNQNTQPQLIYNPYPVQQPILMNNSGGIVNQPNKPDTQMAPNFMNQNPEVEHIIPTFSPDDEKYIKWLKNFIYKCKLHRYPLTPVLCKSLNHLHFEIADAMANPTGSMLMRSKQFYFKKIQTVISDIMLGQLRYSIHVVKR